MANTSYSIQYNKQAHCLEFTLEVFYKEDTIEPLSHLFNNFGLSLTNIIFSAYNKPVVLTYKGLGTHGVYYCHDRRYNEQITDILFLHDKYEKYVNHHTLFIQQNEFAMWKAAIQDADKFAILQALLQDKKISPTYFSKYSSYPASLYELSIYSLVANGVFRDNAAKKIGKLSIPLIIKEDLQHSLRSN